MIDTITAGFQAFLSDGNEEFGAVRDISRDKRQLTLYVENSGEHYVPVEAVTKVAFGKVYFDVSKLDAKLKSAIGHAHDAETA